MKTLITGMLAASVVLTALVAIGPTHARAGDGCPPGMAIDSQGSGQANGPGPCVRVDPNDVIIAGHVVGRDPDPFIRGQIRRERGFGY